MIISFAKTTPALLAFDRTNPEFVRVIWCEAEDYRLKRT